jgi:DNA-binding GntR family transcriptional regulator
MNTPLELVPDSNAQAKAVAFIKEEILSLRLKPMQRLNAGTLATQLGMSRTPVREALSRLAQDGLVTRDEGGGFFVQPLALGEIVDFYRIREALEVEAALEALPHLNAQRLAQLRSLLAEAEALLDPANFAEFVLANRRFHAAIVEASGNRAFALVMAPIVDRVRLVGAMLISMHVARQREVFEENTRIYEALKAGNPKRVEAAVREHVRLAREHAERLLASNPNAWVMSVTR